MKMKMIALALAALFTVGMTTGCTDQHARDMAQEALDKANAAQACCDANSARIDEMYQRMMK